MFPVWLFNHLKFCRLGHKSADKVARKELRMSTINAVNSAFYAPPVATSSLASPASSSSDGVEHPSPQDKVILSDAGRIALGVNDGRLTSAQGQALDLELNTLTQQLKNGGSDPSGLQSQLSQQIYGDTHNGATIPTGTTVSTAVQRDFIQAGRVATQENAGNLTSTQSTGFLDQISQIYAQSQNGASAAATNQAQNQLSVEIYDTAHNVAS
jgi:hypothetical protein